MKNIEERLIRLNDEIQKLETRYQRPAGSVNLVAVSKKWTASHIEQAYVAGQQRFGENYLQEAAGKIAELSDHNIEWHFIGPVQSNKTSQIAELFHWCHSVDRFKIARRLSESRNIDKPPLNLCIQVNVSEETSKSGIAIDEVATLCNQVVELPGVRLRGLMCMPKPSDNLSEQRLPFKRMFQLLDSLNSQGLQLDTLSMGTTHDLEAAVAEGATHIRIGTAIFGQRNN